MSNDNIFNRAITHPNFCGYLPQTLIPPRIEKTLDSIATLSPAQLARYYAPDHYVMGYADPAFSGGEYTRGLSFHDYKAREELNEFKHGDLPLELYADPICTHFEDNVSTIQSISDSEPSPYATFTEPTPTNEQQLTQRNRLITMNANSLNGNNINLSQVFGNVPRENIPVYPQITGIETKTPKYSISPDLMERFSIELDKATNTSTIKLDKDENDALLKIVSDAYPEFDTSDKTINLNKKVSIDIANNNDYVINDNSGMPAYCKLTDKYAYANFHKDPISYGQDIGPKNLIRTYKGDDGKTYFNDSSENTIDDVDINDDWKQHRVVIRENNKNTTKKEVEEIMNQQYEPYVAAKSIPRMMNAKNDVNNKFIRGGNIRQRINSNSSNIVRRGVNEKFVSNRDDGKNTVEKFNSGISDEFTPILPTISKQYLNALKTRAMAVAFYLSNNPEYKHWAKNWNMLKKNLDKSGLLFDMLDRTDSDIAYVINKGEEIKFRILDTNRFVPINVYQYVLYHEMAHMSTEELQHTAKFKELLSLISLAGFELGFIDLNRIPTEFWNTNGQPILNKESLKDEIIDGCGWMMKYSRNPAYYEKLCEYVYNK